MKTSCYLLTMHILLIIVISSCGDTSDLTSSYLYIKMQGVLVSPNEAKGQYEPVLGNFKLKEVFLTKKDDSNKITLLSTIEPLPFTIVNRSQIIFKHKITTDLEKASFESIAIVLDNQAKIISKYSEVVISLSDPIFVYNVPFMINKGKDVTFLLQVKWKNTVLRDHDSKQDSIISPQISIVLDSN